MTGYLRARKMIDWIATTYLHLDTLEAVGSDEADFSYQNVVSIEAALEAAYRAGFNHGQSGRPAATQTPCPL